MQLNDILNKYFKLSDDCIKSITRRSEEFFVARGYDVVKQDEESHHIYFISSGTVRVGLRKYKKEDTVCFGGAGDVFFSLHSYWSGEPSAYHLHALEDCKGWRISFSAWKELEQRYPRLIEWMRTLLAEQLYSFERLYRAFALSSPSQRLQTFWDKTPPSLRNIPPSNLSMVVPLKYIAQYLGMAQQTLSLLRRRLVGK